MQAIVVDRWMKPEELRASEVPDPAPGPGEVLIDVQAAGCNFFDTLIVQGKYQQKPPFPFTPGAEYAGRVRQTGPGVDEFTVGDRVYGDVWVGAFAQRVCRPAHSVRRIPDGMSFEEAAALPVVYPTSHAALVLRARLEAGETLLVHAAAGGVGLAAVQIGKALGARVIATAGGAEKLDVARAAGADLALDYRREDWVAGVLDATDGRGADVIYDPVGGDIADRSLRCIAWNGRLLVVGFASGDIPHFAANRILLKNIAVVGVHWGAYAEREPERVDETFSQLGALYDTGCIRPLISARYPLERVAEALAALGGRATVGKVILEP